MWKRMGDRKREREREGRNISFGNNDVKTAGHWPCRGGNLSLGYDKRFPLQETKACGMLLTKEIYFQHLNKRNLEKTNKKTNKEIRTIMMQTCIAGVLNQWYVYHVPCTSYTRSQIHGGT
uniref:Uncharacterized protein n=1 Tax=Cacopsylla melanoneura TaxID=428564 RepID=A0A8D9F7V3_9HEMI